MDGIMNFMVWRSRACFAGARCGVVSQGVDGIMSFYGEAWPSMARQVRVRPCPVRSV